MWALRGGRRAASAVAFFAQHLVHHRARADALDPALDVGAGRSARAVFALMQKPGQNAAVREACRAALQAHGQRETAVLRQLLALFEGVAP